MIVPPGARFANVPESSAEQATRHMLRYMRRLLIAIASLVLLSAASNAAGFHGTILLPDGAPAAQAQISVVGHSGSTRTDPHGRFEIATPPPPPFTLLVIGAHGEIYNSIDVVRITEELTIRLEPAYVEQMTVTSGVAPNILATPAAGTSVVGRDELEQRKPEHLVEALERTAGVQRRGEGPAAVPVVRGMTGGRTLIMIDDGRVTAERRAGASATFLNPFILGSVEIARGPGSVAYGSDAFGGVIHARPRDPVRGEGGLRYELSQSFESTDLTAAGVEWIQDAARGAILTSVYGRDSGNSSAGGGEEIFNSSYRDYGATLRYAGALSGGMLRLGFSSDHGRDIDAPSADSRIQRTYYPNEDSNRLTASWDVAKVYGFDSLEVRATLSEYGIATNRERLPAEGVTRQIGNSDVNAKDAALRMTAFRALGFGQLTTGVDVASRFNLHATGFVRRYDDSDAVASQSDEVSIDDADRVDTGLFATLDAPLRATLSASGGVRGDYVATQNSGGYFGDHSVRHGAVSGHVSTTWTPRPPLSASLQLASGFREPTLSDRYFRGVSGRGFVIGNPDLDPERSVQFDGSIRWQRARHAVAFYAYHYSIKDLIERYRAGNDFAFRNRGEAVIRGAELEVTVPLAQTLTLQATATVARGEAVDDGAPLDDIPGPNAHVAFHWNSGSTYAFAHGFWYGEDDRPGPVETSRPSYATLDLGAGWRLREWAELRIHARNVFDEQYAGSADANAAPAQGRSVTIFVGGSVPRQ